MFSVLTLQHLTLAALIAASVLCVYGVGFGMMRTGMGMPMRARMGHPRPNML